MRIKLLGTSAGEGIPALFCNCDICVQAQQRQGKDIRMRSGTLIDSDVLVDFSPDLLAHRHRFRLPLHLVKHVVFTHNHSDHYIATNLELMTMPVLCQRDPATIHIYGNEKIVEDYNASGLDATGQFEMHLIQQDQPFEVGDKLFTPLKAEHDAKQNCFVFVIEKGNKCFFHGHDSGFYGEGTWSKLKDKKIDLAVLDCVAALNESYYNHMGLSTNLMVKERMLNEGIADQNTQFVITHFSHCKGFLHDDIQKEASKHNIITAYDGIEFNL